MFEKQKQIDDYRLQHLEQSVIIDERDGPISTIFRIVFGMIYALGAVCIALTPVFCMGRPDFSKYTTGSWLLLALILCIMLFFAYAGLSVAFARTHVEATSEKILTGNTWFGVPVKLKAMPVSELIAIKLAWEDRAHFGSNWQWVGSVLSAKKKKSVQLFSCSKKEAALELANAVAEKTSLPVHDIPQP
ncbi:MAG TPA: hypothetical protein VMB22_07335 [Verrucomicrobiae bacterium]|nr:hypothetical protein [Verrucomicrobiae bacterium]